MDALEVSWLQAVGTKVRKLITVDLKITFFFSSKTKKKNLYFYFCNRVCFELPHGYRLRKFSLAHPKGIEPFPPFLWNRHPVLVGQECGDADFDPLR